jgi:hypothetical protein
MPQFAKQIIVTIFFLGLLGLTAALNFNSQDGALSPEESLKRYGFYLEEASKRAGLDFKHESPTQLDSKLDHIMPIIASMGASVSIVDFDKDGLYDIYVVTSKEGGKNKLYRNKGDGTFEDVAEKVGLADLNEKGTRRLHGRSLGRLR